MHEAAAKCRDIARASVTNWEPCGVTLAGYCYAMRHGMKVQLVTPYRVSHLPHYGVMVCGNITSVDPPIYTVLFTYRGFMFRKLHFIWLQMQNLFLMR